MRYAKETSVCPKEAITNVDCGESTRFDFPSTTLFASTASIVCLPIPGRDESWTD
jgi:hypothetical protein